MSAINNTSIATRVIMTPKFNEHLMSFIDTESLMRMQLVAKKIPHEQIEKIIRQRLFDVLPEDHFWKQWGGNNALRGVTIRNVFVRIESPLSDYPGTCLAGFEKIGDKLQYYTLERDRPSKTPRLPCLPKWTTECRVKLRGEIPPYLDEREPVCCEFRLLSNGPGCWSAIRYLSCSLFEWCCFTPGRNPNFGWLSTQQAYGENIYASRAPEKKEEADEVDLENPVKDKNV